MDTLTPNSDELAIKSYNKRKFNHLKKRRKLRRVKILMARLRVLGRLASFCLIIWAFLLLLDLPQWYLSKDIFFSFPSKNLEIEGYNIVSPKQVINELKDLELPDKPLYLVDTDPIRKKLENLPAIKKVFVRRYWLPARLRIVINERTPVISIAPTPKVEPIAVFTKDSDKINILGQEYLPLPEFMKTYKVVTYDDYKNWRPSLIPYIEYLAMYLESATDENLLYLDARNPDDAYAQMDNFRLRLGNLNAREIFKRIDKVTAVVPEAIKIKDNIKYIDLRWNNVSIKLKNKDKG